jgi:hypothetical protein
VLSLPWVWIAPGLAFALFRDAKRVGGMGISEFRDRIFSRPIFLLIRLRGEAISFGR